MSLVEDESCESVLLLVTFTSSCASFTGSLTEVSSSLVEDDVIVERFSKSDMVAKV